MVTAPTEYGERLLDVLARLEAHYDLDRWHWQTDTPPLDVCLGAILVQHTTWRSVETALDRLRAAGAFDVKALLALPETELAEIVRPAGLLLTKARRLHAFASLCRDAGGLDALLALEPGELRRRLLATPGIGAETADVILLFAAQALVFVHDAYAARLCRRLGLGPERDAYAAWQGWFEAGLPRDLRVYQRLRAGIVTHCKETCRARPLCERCPLLEGCSFGQSRPSPS